MIGLEVWLGEYKLWLETLQHKVRGFMHCLVGETLEPQAYTAQEISSSLKGSTIITTTTTTTTVSAIPPTAAWLAKLTTQDFAHFELPSSHLFTDDPSTIQVACSVLLTGAITVFFFRSVQRRAKRAKELVYSLSFFLRGV